MTATSWEVYISLYGPEHQILKVGSLAQLVKLKPIQPDSLNVIIYCEHKLMLLWH
jgi:hypothetical protein